MAAVRRRRQQRGDIGANGDEAGDADVEQPRLPPLQIEPEADDRVDERDGEKEAEIGDAAGQVRAHSFLPNNPVGRINSTATG